MPVYKYLDLSTAHISQEDADKLDRTSPRTLHPLIIRKHEYGWWIHVPVGKEAQESLLKVIDRILNLGFSIGLPAALFYAVAKGCYWINLDCDASEELGLPIFEWKIHPMLRKRSTNHERSESS